jgi:hypothetical protein
MRYFGHGESRRREPVEAPVAEALNGFKKAI